jgi:mannose-6-phosphate isomerase-like protein (cupin superfamily)
MADVWFVNEPMGQRARIITLPHDTDGLRFVLEYINRPFAGEHAVPPHFHPTYTETFDILSGSARYRVGREERSGSVGDRIVMPAGTPHVHPWSDSDEELHVRQTAEADPPDLAGLTASLQAAITIFGLAGAGRVNARGLPSLLQLAVLARTTMPATFLAGPPRALQRLLFGLLSTVGRAAGYRASYPEFGVLTGNGLTRQPAARR